MRLRDLLLPFTIGGTGLAILFVLALVTWWPREPISRDNAAKIQHGMSLAEVEAILGGPARDASDGFRPAKLFAVNGEFAAARTVRLPKYRTWLSREAGVRVVFDRADRALGVATVPMEPIDAQQGAMATVRRWLRL